MSTVRSRIVSALGAGAFGQAVTICIQLASLPLFLRSWTLTEYGVWLVLSAMPAYLSMADVGLVTAAGNQMTMAVGRNDSRHANSLFQSSLAFMLVVCGSIASVTLLIVAFAPVPGLTTVDRRLALAALAFGTVLSLFSGLADAVFRATGRYSTGLLIANMVRLAEWAGWMIGLWLVGSFSAVALGGLAARVFGCALMIALSARGAHDIRWGIGQARLAEIRKLVKPAVSFMAFPLSNALSFQGMTMLVAQLFGPATVALFNAYRTLARVAVQLTAIFSHSLWPELSRLYGQGGPHAVIRLYRRSAYLCAGLSLLLSVLLFFVGPLLLRVWTHGEIDFQPPFMALMLAYAAIAGIWHVPRVMLLATNQHTGLAWWVAATSALSLAMTAVAGPRYGLLGVGAALILAEALVAAICMVLASHLLRPQLQGRQA